MIKMNKLKWMFSVVMISLGINGASQWNGEKVPFAMPEFKEPVFKTDTFNILAYGAKGDGITKNTEAFAKAMDACSKNGGGVVLIPSGLWLTGPIEIKSNINIHTEAGAMVLFSTDFNDYPMVMSYYEGNKAWRCQSPISSFNQTNIAITGKGVFDGSGDTWRFVKKSKLTSANWKTLVSSGGVLSPDKNTWYPSQSSLNGNNLYSEGKLPAADDKNAYLAIKDYLRPMMVSLVECKSVLLDGPTFQNSPSWCIHPLLCEQLFVRNINVRNPWYAQNGDGLDIESCSVGEVNNCTFDVGDDAICIKSGRDAEGRKRGKPTEYFNITDCIVYHGHGGFVIGSEMSGGVRNLYVANCTFIGTDIGLRFKSTRGRGGVVENIYVTDISMVNIPAEAIRFDMYYMGTSPIPEGDEKVVAVAPQKTYVASEETPSFKNFYLKNIYCNGGEQAIFLQGLPEMKINNINLENSTFKTKKGFTCIDGENINLSNVSVEVTDAANAAYIANTGNVTLDKFEGKGHKGKLLKVTGANSSKVTISAKSGKMTENDLEIADKTKQSVIIK